MLKLNADARSIISVISAVQCSQGHQASILNANICKVGQVTSISMFRERSSVKDQRRATLRGERSRKIR